MSHLAQVHTAHPLAPPYSITLHRRQHEHPSESLNITHQLTINVTPRKLANNSSGKNSRDFEQSKRLLYEVIFVHTLKYQYILNNC